MYVQIQENWAIKMQRLIWGLTKGQALRKLTGCENDLSAWFDHLQESFWRSVKKDLTAFENQSPSSWKTINETFA